MAVRGTQDLLYRVEAIDRSEERKKRQTVSYGGHCWTEGEEEILLEGQPLLQRSGGDKEKGTKPPKPLIMERVLLDKAMEMLERLTTVEEKVAQLFFYQTEATYDAKKQKEIIELIEKGQLGGLVFVNGSYRREAYLIEHYQRISKTPLLVGNDFMHNLSFYFSEGMPDEEFTLQHCRDLGKALMGQNRSIGVHFLFDREGFGRARALIASEEQKKSFRKGIQQAQGIVARDLVPEQAIHRLHMMNFSLLWSCKGTAVSGGEGAEQFVGIRTLFLHECNVVEKELLASFEKGYEGFLVGEDLSVGIGMFVKAVEAGLITHDELDKRVLKILIMKASVKR